ncbi:hypothetical protein JOC86_002236 [Bacillus pakistanensis]|uniref:Glycerophosphoryl diester phosphodiesterase membrane domain-containing protein n=1 Tax=Rossellomorea pakistanensis TaxID=992288 RepID=A0ABS2ND68_9BACI|nr:hypothetical protein [Bacillus pakistanensis]MBM7585694.1 hypothetical protein [Bacillus pakistanensis]
MNTQFNRPKGFGEILDHTFRLSKSHFTKFFLILLIVLGPIYLLQAIADFMSGTNFFREVGVGGPWYEQIISGFDQSAEADYEEFTPTSLIANLIFIIGGLISVFVAPVGGAAILIGVDRLRKKEEFTVKSALKQAFSRYWPILGSSLLFGVIVFGMIIGPIFISGFVGIFGAVANPFLGILMAILLFLGFAVGIGYFLTRWSFFFASVVLETDSPGLSRSWRLTRNRGWICMGIYFVFILITSSVSFAIELSFGLLLGNSVLLMIIGDLVSLFTTVILSVGFAVMYFDLKVRNDADDLDEMMDEYTAIQ